MSTIYCRDKGCENTNGLRGQRRPGGAIFIGAVTDGLSEEVTFELRHAQSEGVAQQISTGQEVQRP